MPIGGAGIAAGIGALWLFLKGRGGGAPPQCPTGWVFDTTTGKCTPVGSGLPNTSGVDNTARDVKIAAAIAPQVASVAGGLVQALATGASGGGGTAAATTSGGGATVVAGSTALVTTGAGWGGAALVGAILVAIIATIVGQQVQMFQAALMSFFNTPTTVPARTWFTWFVGAALTAGKPPSLGYVPAYGPYTLKLPSDVIRKAVLTALYLNYAGLQSTYDALAGFWSRSTGQVPQPGTPVPIGGSMSPGQPWYVISQPSGFTTEQIKKVLAGPGLFQCAPDAGCDYNAIVAPASFGEAQSAALSLLGDYWQPSINLQEFNGKLQAIAFATTQLFKEFMPSPFDFVTAVRDTCVPGWSIQEATYWSTAKQPVTAFWLVDPVTGNRVAPAEIRRTMTMVVSMKGMEVSRGVFAGRFAGRRFAGFGDGSECVDPRTGELVACGTRAGTVEAWRAASGFTTRTTTHALEESVPVMPRVLSRSAPPPSGGVLPWAAGAWLLLKVLAR